jgi:hypothetical protein
MNIKIMLIEKERTAYIEGNTVLAKFFADTLDYITGLEETINKQALEIENNDWLASENK